MFGAEIGVNKISNNMAMKNLMLLTLVIGSQKELGKG
jgi:hypothetical protein